MHVFHFAAECFPVAKVGGLADVVGALPKYLQQAGIKTSVVIPYYNKPFTQQYTFEMAHQGQFQQGDAVLLYDVLKEPHNLLGFELFLIRIPGLLDREEVYSYPDEDEQFLAYQHAALDWLCTMQIRPDVLHCHDHHAGLIPFYIEYASRFTFLKGVPTVATVHNGQYQGWMSWDMARLMPAFDNWQWGMLDWGGVINRLAALIKCSWIYTTVSEGYLNELFRQANGLEGLFFTERAKAYGIVNGIDREVWDTATDKFLLVNFDQESSGSGKTANKKQLLARHHLNPELPLIAFIGRFALEKGADLIPTTILSALQKFNGQVNFFVLGSGNTEIENHLFDIFNRYPQHLGLHIGYNEKLAHQLYAAADYLLMPSRVEPCGLNQLYAMRYGTLPIVRATGGLKDTVKDINTDNGYGILFQEADVTQALEAIERALAIWNDTKRKNILREKIMKLDFSWDNSASKYIELYKKLMN